MSIKRILAPVPASPSKAAEAEGAILIAKTLGAHLEAIYVKESPREIHAGEVGSRAVLRSDLMQAREHEADKIDKLAQEHRQQFIHACESNSVPVVNGDGNIAGPPTASWCELEGSFETATLSQSAGADLIIASSASIAEPLKQVAESVLLQTRRPVMLISSRMPKDLTKKVLIAWDESPECWHAVSAALPFMERAKETVILTIGKDKAVCNASQEKVRAYLNCHGIDAQMKVVLPGAGSIGEDILMAGSAEEATLIVMGAYSHSRLREMLFGGATHHVLKSAAATPVLMAH